MIPEGKITTHSNQGAEAPAPAAPATPSAAPTEASPPKAAPETAASEPATPPEKEKPKAAQAPEGESDPEKETTGKDPESEGRKASRSYERRIDRVIRQREEQRIAREAAEAKLAEALARQAPAADPDEPRADQFTDIEEFKKAVAAHAVKKAEAARDKTQREESRRQQVAQLAERWEEAADEGTAKYPDFHEKVGDLKAGIAAWSDAIMECENGHDVAYHLASNSKEAERIVGLPPHKQFLEIGKLSVKLAAQPEPVRKPSKAPPPIAPESGAATVPVTDPFKPQSFQDYLRTRPKEFSGGFNR